MRIATGNDLASGAVLWWAGDRWSRHVADAIDVGADGDALVVGEEAARRINVPYLIDAEPTAAGPRPRHIKDRIRAAGPTTHPALAIHPELPVTGDDARATGHLRREARTTR